MTNPQVILLAKLDKDYKFLPLESLAALYSPDHGLHWFAIAWLFRPGWPLELRGTLLCHCRALSRLRPELSGF